MFGWEFPPHISGGLGTACYGLTKQLSETSDMDVTMVLPKIYGDENQHIARLVSAEHIDIGEKAKKYTWITNELTHKDMGILMSSYTSPEEYEKIIKKISFKQSARPKNHKTKRLNFTGKYGVTLFEEIKGYSEVGAVIGSKRDFDMIHAHDWLTYPAGIAAKKASGKPLIAHIHATEFDRSGEHYNPVIYRLEKQGLHAADKVIAVSDYTKNIVVKKYGVDPGKVVTIHNGVDITYKNSQQGKKVIPGKVVTYLGRITMQKGPEYFIEASYKVLQKMNDIRFVMAGAGDMFEKMVSRTAQLKINDKFYFTGFLQGDEIQQLFSQSDLYVMPSVSEPFGICPLEAMAAGVPVIISKQSGVSEVVKHAIKVNFWDTDAMADAIYGLVNYNKLSTVLKLNGQKEIEKIRWKDTAEKVRKIYYQVIHQRAS